jgi:hypothetical protein
MTFYDIKTLVVLRALREKLARLLNNSFRNPSKPWTEDEEVFFGMTCRFLGVGANDKDRAFS